jgi:branched-chain amino acid transport system ATP-binding protein
MKSLALEHVTKQFAGVSAIDNLSLQIPQGRVTGLVGPNGSGKTTLVHILTGIHPFDTGVVHVGGRTIQNIRSHTVAGLGVTRTFQQVRLFGQMSVLDNVLIACTQRSLLSALSTRETRENHMQARTALERVGLWDKHTENSENLSYGQHKLLEIARALCMNTGIVLLDEPFAGLFPEMRERVSNIVRNLRKEGKTVVLIEHDMNIIRTLCDHVVVLDAGKLLAEGPADEVLARRDVREAYLGE